MCPGLFLDDANLCCQTYYVRVNPPTFSCFHLESRILGTYLILGTRNNKTWVSSIINSQNPLSTKMPLANQYPSQLGEIIYAHQKKNFLKYIIGISIKVTIQSFGKTKLQNTTYSHCKSIFFLLHTRKKYSWKPNGAKGHIKQADWRAINSP